MYRLTLTDYIVRIEDGAIIPPDPSNRDRQAYVAWLADGNSPEPYQPPPLTIKDYERAIQGHLDAQAALRGWDSIYTAAMRSGFSGPWQAEGVAWAQWMDACWVKSHEVMANADPASPPSIADVIAALPPPPSFSV